MIIVSEFCRKQMLRLRDLVTGALTKAKVTPNSLTLIGMLINFAAGWAFAVGKLFLAGIFIIFAGAFDILDGSVAKRRGMVTKFGSFFDSTIDRYSDLALYGGIVIYFLRQNLPSYVLLGISALIGAQLISYTRAKAETFIPECKIGFWERTERTVYLLIGAFANNLYIVILIEAFMLHTTAIQRILLARRELYKLEGIKTKRPPLFLVLLSRLIFWEFKRYTITYDLMVLFLGLLPFVVRLR